MTISTKVETVTPAKAEAWLGQAALNRNLRPARIEQFAEAMRRGEWRESGEAVKFNGQYLIDGQHRLHAVVEANVPVKMLVVRGLASNVMEVLDTGTRRTLGDLLRIRGEVSTTVLASVLQGLAQTRVALETGEWPSNRRTTITNIQALELLDAEPGIRESVRAVQNFRGYKHGIQVQPTVLIVAHYHLETVDEEDRDAFFEGLKGIEVAENSPIHKFRKRFSGGFDMPTNRRDQLAYLFKTWNYWRSGEYPALLLWKPGGKKPERFPVPK